MSRAGAATTALERYVRAQVARLAPVRAVATAATAGLVTVRRADSTTADGEQYARLDGFDVESGDELVGIVLPNLSEAPGQPAPPGKPVFAKLIRTALSTAAKLSRPLLVRTNDAAALRVETAGGVMILLVNGNTGEITTGDGYSVGVQGPLTARTVNTPVIRTKTQTDADTTSTTDTVNYVTAISLAVPLGAGTWTVRAMGWLDGRHSAAGSIFAHVEIGGTDGGDAGRFVDATHWSVFKMDSTKTGVAGGGDVTVKVEYRAGTAGTATAFNPALWVAAERTA